MILVLTQFLKRVNPSFILWISQQVFPLTDLYFKSLLSFPVHCEGCCLMNISIAAFIILLLHSWLDNGFLYHIRLNRNSSTQNLVTTTVWLEFFLLNVFLILFAQGPSLAVWMMFLLSLSDNSSNHALICPPFEVHSHLNLSIFKSHLPCEVFCELLKPEISSSSISPNTYS